MNGEAYTEPKPPEEKGKNLFSRRFPNGNIGVRCIMPDVYSLVRSQLQDYSKNMSFFDPDSPRFGTVEIYLIAGSIVYSDNFRIRFHSETQKNLEAILALFGIQDCKETDSPKAVTIEKS